VHTIRFAQYPRNRQLHVRIGGTVDKINERPIPCRLEYLAKAADQGLVLEEVVNEFTDPFVADVPRPL
jgi:hypothetical protein